MKKIGIIISVLVLSLILTGCQNQDFTFELIGETYLNHTVDSPYNEKGFMAKSDGNDISSYVTIENNIDTTASGDYEVTYTLDYENITETLTRHVYYRDQGCSKYIYEDDNDDIVVTNLTQCGVQFTEYLDTYITLRFYYEDDSYHDQATHIYNNVENILKDYHKLSDKYDVYDGYVNVKSINNNPTEVHTIDQKLFDMIQFTLEHQDEVNNRFNIALGPVLNIWHDYRDNCQINNVCEVPSMTELENADAYTNPADIVLDEQNYTIQLGPSMSLDLGGVSKGFISGVLTDYLDALDLYGYLINNGESNISIGGLHPSRDNGKYILAITDPTFRTNYYATVYLSDGDQLVTSGDYQKYYIVDDTVYHHIIHNETLMPERYSRSVSIVTDDPGLADLYSTALFTMTIQEGQTFVNNIDGLEAIWYGLDDTIYFSENFEEDYLIETFK
ncbi:MAG: FAD:protein FMN transferase [Candidatus Izimaplasma sp.]|nr:FAD:protein FMN transferase [Candidatus Izimaplasma bacterium]